MWLNILSQNKSCTCLGLKYIMFNVPSYLALIWTFFYYLELTNINILVNITNILISVQYAKQVNKICHLGSSEYD